MKTKSKGHKKLLSLALVVVMVITLTTTMIFLNANALSSSVTVSGHNHVNSAAPLSLDAGQVFTWKNVSDSDSTFGSINDGYFSMTFNAVGGSLGSSTTPLIESTGLTFTDTLNSDFNFVTSSSGINVYIDGSSTATTVPLSFGTTYSYSGSGVGITFDTATKVVTYSISPTALKPVATGSYLPSYVSNSLKFGVILNNSNVGTYTTNDPSSCIATFTPSTSNPYYTTSSTSTYTNTPESSTWTPFSIDHTKCQFALIGGQMHINWARLYTDSTNYYEFSTGLSYDPLSTFDAGFHISLAANDYICNGSTVRISTPIDISVDQDPATFIVHTHYISGTASLKVTTSAKTQFTVTTPPASSTSTSVTVTIGSGPSTTYTGTTIARADSANWTFTYTSGSDIYTMQLVGGNTLKVTKITTGSVSQTLVSYGTINLSKAGSNSSLAITKSASATTVALGTRVDYTITATYSGSESISYFTFSDAMFSKMVPGSLSVLLDNVPTNSYTLTGTAGTLLTVTPSSTSTTPVVKFSYGVIFTAPGSYPNTVIGVAYPSASSQTGSTQTVHAGINNNGTTLDNGKSYTAPKLLASQPSGSASVIVDVVMPQTPSNSPSTSPSTSPSQQPSPSPSPSQGIAGDQDKVSPSPSPSPSDKGVAGEAEKLPQTGGISTSTTIGFIGLALLATGGAIFIVFGKNKKHS